MQKLKTNKGITLIALVITIIVMLILVGVSVTVALNGGLFTTAQDATDRTKAERDNEIATSNGDIIDQYLSETGSGTDIEYAIGTEVTIGETGENFYVIKDEGAKLVLLAKKNIALDDETQKYIQADGINPVGFSNAGYWVSEEEEAEYRNVNSSETYNAYEEKWSKTYPRNLNDKEYDTVRGNDAVAKARQYAENSIENGATGRLMTYEEAQPLSQSNDDDVKKILYGTYTEGAYLNYWLSSAYNISHVWYVNGFTGGLHSHSFDYDATFVVRPVIEISESAVTKVP